MVPAGERYILVTFDDEERADPRFDINVREHFAVALACMMFGPSWHTVFAPQWPHIRCCSDNQTTVSRTNKLSARHEFAQELNRTVGLAEALWCMRVSTAHLSGAWNTAADAGSRLSSSPHLLLFTNAVALWTQVPVPDHLWRIYATFSSTYRPRHWPQARDDCTTARGSSGADGAHNTTNPADYPATWTPSPSTSRCSPSLAGSATPHRLSTRRRPCSHVSWHHQVRFGYAVRLTDSLCSGCDGCRGPPNRRSPVTITHLLEIHRSLNFDQPYDRVLWRATVMGYFFLLRRSEYLGSRGGNAWFIIQRRDIQLTDDNGRSFTDFAAATHITIKFRGSKTDQVGEATTRTLAKTMSPWICPVRAARALLRENKDATVVTPLCWANGAVLSARALEKIIKMAAMRCGEGSSKFGTHSLRCGGATVLFQAGCEDSTIKLQGRWTSDCYQRYIHMEVTSREKLADMMVTSSSGPKRARRPQAAPLGG